MAGSRSKTGRFLAPSCTMTFLVPVGGTTGHPESTEGSVAHPPRDLLGEDICYPIDTKNSGTGGWWIWNPVEADRGTRTTGFSPMHEIADSRLLML